ncbi:hypothetical protein AQUCO_24200001v1 [Aquilegia coerulea]|uniref:Uncharacterized protein n=1 Tax=Aquilegia coerulea TaxID=218851 RepID=A0A2G5C1X9_AQUCA|nr:hypothetical protein AQUCO_24200001v1 [Aquilegia coerulea]
MKSIYRSFNKTVFKVVPPLIIIKCVLCTIKPATIKCYLITCDPNCYSLRPDLTRRWRRGCVLFSNQQLNQFDIQLN